ncbi:MAG: hypothetical protein COC23_04885 [Hyphomicrobiales bacterium]|nr:MAG: hypothetical protein COC23_04885 [Hyphomicrobiales bacterium]
MLESGLFFTLGFLASALLALMVAPVIWRRAVVLTRQRIESSVPLTLNEIQADKDQLRAEFAMSTRRLEVSLEQLKDRAAEQVIEVNRRRDEVLALEEEQSEKTDRISELHGQSEELRAEMRDREEKLGQANISLATVEAALEEKSLDFEKADREYREVIDQFDDQKIEMVASETRLGNAGDEVRDLKTLLKSKRDDTVALKDEKKALNTKLKRERDRNLQLEKKMARLQTTMTDMEARLDRRDRDNAKLRDKSDNREKQASSADQSLNTIQTENVKLKAELADAAQRTEALLKDASDENIENAVAVIENERKKLRKELKLMEKEREDLQSELSAVKLSNGEDWEVERRENAIVRERINDLAAQVTAMTADIEGPESPVNSALKKKGKKAVRSRVKVAGAKKTATAEVSTLADRIRALQQAAEKA